MIKVFLVDDHVLIRKGIALVLENYKDLKVIGDASTTEECIQTMYDQEIDVILMDISIPNGIDGFTATQKVKKLFPDTKVIMLTMHSEIAYIQKAIDCNADGYILKNSQDSQVYKAIQAVYSGRKYYDIGLPKEQLEKMFKKKGKNNTDVLSSREQEIVRLTVLGYTNLQIADKLFISCKTVESHKSNIMQKLALKSKAELIQYGITNNYIV